MTVIGPSFIALQVRDLDRAAAFYETQLGLRRAAVNPPGAVVFDTSPVSFAVREPLPGVDLEAAHPRPGVGVALWLHSDNARDLRASLENAGVELAGEPFDGPFGWTFSFVDPDGYVITIHDRA